MDILKTFGSDVPQSAPINLGTGTANSTPAVIPGAIKNPAVATPVAPAASVPAPTNSPAPKTGSAAVKVAAPITPAPTPSPVAPATVELTNKDTGQKVTVSKADWDTNPAYKDANSPWSIPNANGKTDFQNGTGISGYDAAMKAEADKKASESLAKVEPTAVDKAKNISNLLSQGYSDVNNLATATGLSVDEVNNLINSDENLSYKLGINKNSDKQDKEYKDYKASMDAITNGTFALTATEQANIKSIQDQFDLMRKNQIVANQNYEGAVTTGEIRSGRQEFMNQISSGIFKQAIDDGLQKVRQIESDAIGAINKYKDAIEAKNYKAADAAYTAAQKYLSDKSTTIKDLHTATMDEYKRQQDLVKASQDAIEAALTQQKLKQDIAKTTIEGLTPALSGASDEIVQDLAAYYGIDPNMLTGAVIGESQKFEKEMIGKGFRTVNPADVERLRSEGAEVVTYNGRAYMKEPELKSVTNKGNVDFFKGTKKVGTVGLTGGGPSVGASDDEKAIQEYNSDVKDVRQKVAAGTWFPEDARKYLVSQYNLTPENASIVIPD